MNRHFWKTQDSPPPLEHPEHRCPRDLFGGGGGGTTQTSTITKSDPWSGVQPYLSDVFAKAQGLYNAGGYSGPYIGAQSPYTQQAIQQQAQQAMDPNSLVSRAQGQLGKTIDGDYMSIDNNPAIQAAVDAARRTVNQQFSGDNYGSSANQEWLARGAASAASPLLAQERQNQMAVLTAAPGLQAANTGLLASAGASQDARSQAEIAAAQQQAQAPWDLLRQYQQGIAGGAAAGGTTTGTQEQPYYDNSSGQMLGAGLSLASIFFSDRRLKSNIRRIGTHRLGIGIYEYDMAGKRQVGVMADEVEAVMPEAVIDVGGLKAVNYGRL